MNLFIGTGDIALDMENQVKANAIRIQVLEEQNEGLRNSITKVMSLQRGSLPKGQEKVIILLRLKVTFIFTLDLQYWRRNTLNLEIINYMCIC